MIDTVIFDLDGTLLNTLDDLADSVNYALSSFSMKNRSLDEIRHFVGNGVNTLVKRSVPEGTDSKLTEEVFSVFREHYLKNMENKTAPFCGIIPLLEKLKSLGYKTGVVSNKLDEATKALCKKTFGVFIDYAKGAEGEDDRKPKPDNVYKCIASLGSKKESCIYVGDSEVDLQTAKNSGLLCVSVLWGFRTKEELLPYGADLFIKEPEELINVLNEINKEA